jgi:Undecaprenyl-phosphate galactose phosphotransferase WbaP
MRHLPRIIETPAYNQLLLILSIILITLFARKKLYPAIGMNYVDELGNIFSSTSLAFLLILGVTFVFQTSVMYSRFIIAISWFLCLILIPLDRYLTRKLLIRWELWGDPAVIIGEKESARQVYDYFSNHSYLGLRPVAICSAVSEKNESMHGGTELGGMESKNKYGSAQTALILINNLDQIDKLSGKYLREFRHVIMIRNKQGSFGLDGLVTLDFSDILGFQVKNNLREPFTQFIRRCVELLITAPALLVLSPLFLLVGLAIMADSPGPVFYFQKRIGKYGLPIFLVKFRTMYMNAESILNSKLKSDSKARHEWECYQKLQDDPRVTKIGKFLRRYSIDELPQLWNVIKGNMSLVGPRPILENQRILYGKSYDDYTEVSPGITGLWQVSGRNKTTFAQRAEFDHEYIQRWSIWLDIFILLKTIKVVLLQEGAY